MKRIAGIILALAMVLLATAGCEEEANCAAACEHRCEVCGTGCDEEAVDTCISTCINLDTPASRTDCIIDAPTCDDIWKC